jgi:hypothetical protein
MDKMSKPDPAITRSFIAMLDSMDNTADYIEKLEDKELYKDMCFILRDVMKLGVKMQGQGIIEGIN